MQYTYTRLLSEAELLQHLRSQDEVVLRISGVRWQEIERQVERLGFGDQFFVSAVNGAHGECCKIIPYVLHKGRVAAGDAPILSETAPSPESCSTAL